MKKGIHPKYVESVITCACGEVIHTRSTKKEIKVGVCSKCHPFFTGTQKFLDTAGRVEKFIRKYEAAKGMKKKVRKRAAVETPQPAGKAGAKAGAAKAAPEAAPLPAEGPAPERGAAVVAEPGAVSSEAKAGMQAETPGEAAPAPAQEQESGSDESVGKERESGQGPAAGETASPEVAPEAEQER